MNGNGTKPKLDLILNKPLVIRLMQSSPAKGESMYGKWWLYNVEDDNHKEHSFFAPEQVQKFIEENQIRKGDVIQITKTMVKNGRNNVLDFQIELISRNTEPETKQTGSHSDDIAIMKDCLKSAIELQSELGPVVDVNRIALSLYISRSKNGNGYQF